MSPRRPSPELVALCRTLARLTHPRLRTSDRLREAHALLRADAADAGLPEEEWSDKILLLLLERRLG